MHTRRAFLRQKMITREIIDVHTHVFPEKIAVRAADNIVDYYGIPRQGNGTPEGLIEGAKGFESIRFIISSAALRPDRAEIGNSYLLELARCDSRFVPLASFHIGMGFDAAVAELERAKALGAKGIKLHPDFQHFSIDNPEAIEIYKECARMKLPILFHVGDTKSDLSQPKQILTVCEKVPELTVIAAHMCGYSVWEEAEKYLIGTPVYTETSEARLGMDARGLYRLAEKHGIDRVMFGSDYPLWNTSYAYDGVEECGFSEEEKSLIYSENAKKVFGL